MGYSSNKRDRLNVLRYHVLKKITKDRLSFLRQILPNGRIVGCGVFCDAELRFRVFYEHGRLSHGNIGRWDRNLDMYAPFKAVGSGLDYGSDFISLYAKVKGATLVGGMTYDQAIEELAKDLNIPSKTIDNVVEGWRQVEITDLNISNSINDVKGYFQHSQQEIEMRKHSNSHLFHKIYSGHNDLHKNARPLYDREGKCMGLMLVDVEGKTTMKTLWNKKPHGKKFEWHYSNFAEKPYPFDKTHEAFRAKKKVVYVISDPVLAEQFEWWQEEGVTSLKGALVQTWFGGKETVADLDWEALKHHDLRVVIRETEEDLQLARIILEQVVGQHGLKSISFYRYSTEDVYTDSVLYSFDESRALDLTREAFLFKLTKEDIYVGLGMEERTEVLDELLEEQEDSLVCIEGVLEREAATMLYAYDGVGKSMIALSMGYALASGKDVFGETWKVPSRKRVLYIDAENSKSILEQREPALRRHYEVSESTAYFEMMSSKREKRRYDLTDEEFRNELNRKLFKPSGGRRKDVIILDNWSALYTGEEEKAWQKTKDWLTDLLLNGLAILFVHHASDADPSKPDGYKKKNRFFDNRFYAVKEEVPSDQNSQPMFVSVRSGKSRSGAGHTDFTLRLSFVKNKAEEERAFWLINADHLSQRTFALRAQGMTYEQIGKALGHSKNTVNDSIKDHGHPDPGKWAKSK